MDNTLNLEADKLQQQMTLLVATPITQEETDVTIR